MLKIVDKGSYNEIIGGSLDLNSGSGKKRHAYLKDIVALRDAGIIVQLENPNHGRRPLYALGPNVIVCKEEKFITADLGCYVMRFAR